MTSDGIVDHPLLRDEVAAFVNTLSSSATSRPPLKPRQPWMLEDDPRSDADADADWHCATERLLGQSLGAYPGSVTMASLRTFACTASSVPFERFDSSHAYVPPLRRSSHLHRSQAPSFFTSTPRSFVESWRLASRFSSTGFTYHGMTKMQTLHRNTSGGSRAANWSGSGSRRSRRLSTIGRKKGWLVNSHISLC